MQTLSKSLIGLLAVLLFVYCSAAVKSAATENAPGDTTKMIIRTNGDTVFKQYTILDDQTGENHMDTIIYSTKPIDTTIIRSNFYFEAGDYNIYFDKRKVVRYCDSIIRNTPSGKIDEDYNSWYVVGRMTELKKAAQSYKEMETVMDSWLSSLLERFNPFIVNAKTNQKSKFLLKQQFLSKYSGYRNYSTISEQSDTTLIDYEQDFMEFQHDSLNIKNGM